MEKINYGSLSLPNIKPGKNLFGEEVKNKTYFANFYVTKHSKCV